MQRGEAASFLYRQAQKKRAAGGAGLGLRPGEQISLPSFQAYESLRGPTSNIVPSSSTTSGSTIINNKVEIKYENKKKTSEEAGEKISKMVYDGLMKAEMAESPLF